MADGSVIINTELDSKGLKSGLSKLGSIANSALKGVTVATGAVTAAFAGLVTASVNARGELEQQIGGVQTLFANELGDASEIVIKNANNAYKTAGMSASDYMSTVTSYSASLLQSLGGDTAKAAEVADMAIIDMADNANKMGTSMEAIQNAYQGFAKQNYTMLDNLKLGYGGTKTEMERLLEDAQKISGIEYDISNLSDVYNAIHVIQNELGITGTTAKEASETLQGSFASMKASWDNFLSGSGDLSQVVDTVTEVIANVVRIVNEAIPDIIESITTSLPEFAQLGANLLTQLITGISTYMPQLMTTALQIVQTLMQTLIENLPQLIEMGIQVIVQLILGIAEMMPELIPQIVDCVILIVETLIDNLDLLVDAGIELLLAITLGIIEALPKLVDKVPEIINKLFDALMRNLPKIIDAGVQIIIMLITGLINTIPNLIGQIPNLIKMVFNALTSGFQVVWQIGKGIITGIWSGIQNATSWLANKITGWCNTIVSNIKGFFGIHSPSRLFRDEIGENLGLGMGEGFEESLSSVYKDMQKAVEHENAKLTSNLTSNHQIQVSNEDNRQSRLESIDNNKEIVVNSRLDVDGKQMANVVNRVNARQNLQYGIA